MIRKLLAAAMLFAAPAAFAQVDATEVGPELREEAKDVGSTAKENAKEWSEQAGVAETSDKTFAEGESFKLEGTVERATRERLTIAREGLPSASLDIRNDTEVMVDGQKMKASDLEDGMDVTAHFQIEGREPVAVKVEARADQAMGGAGEAGTDKKDKKNKDHKKD